MIFERERRTSGFEILSPHLHTEALEVCTLRLSKFTDNRNVLLTYPYFAFNDMSKLLKLCVKAPTEIKSTPVSA